MIMSMAGKLATFFCLLVCAISTSTAHSVLSEEPFINVTFGGLPAFYTFEGAEQAVNLTIVTYDGDSNAVLQFESSNPRIFQVVNQSSTYVALSPDEQYPKSVTFFVHGIALGIERLDVVMMWEGSVEKTVVESLIVKVNLKPTVMMVVIKYIMLILVIIGFVNMGGTIDLGLIWQKLRRPWGVLIGIVCQFLIMPPLAFGLAKLLRLDAPSAIGLVLDGSCPGGYLSNILSVMLDVDYVLSLTMTFCSNILAMGMMPLNLLIYTPPLTGGSQELETPFMEIGIQLLLLFIPISVGMFFRYKSPRIHRMCKKLLKPLSSLLLILMLATSLPFQLFIFAAPPATYGAAILLPLCGGLIGFTIAKLACLPVKSMSTIALETGVQNALLATTIITFFYPHPESEIASRAPYLILLMTVLEGILLVVVYMIYKNFFAKHPEDEEAIVDGKDIDHDSKKPCDVVKNGSVKEVNENEVDFDATKSQVESHQGCQTDFDDLCYTNPNFEQS